MRRFLKIHIFSFISKQWSLLQKIRFLLSISTLFSMKKAAIKYSSIPSTYLTQVSSHISTMVSKQFRTGHYKTGKIRAAKKESAKQTLVTFPAAFIPIKNNDKACLELSGGLSWEVLQKITIVLHSKISYTLATPDIMVWFSFVLFLKGKFHIFFRQFTILPKLSLWLEVFSSYITWTSNAIMQLFYFHLSFRYIIA